jgi:hypothetical protein
VLIEQPPPEVELTLRDRIQDAMPQILDLEQRVAASASVCSRSTSTALRRCPV